MDKTPHEPLKDACRLCDTTFNDIKERHQLLFGALEVKPAYTVALEEITGPLQTSDEFISVCGSCRTLLDRYHSSCCEVERIGSLVKKLTHNNTSDRVKGGLNEVKSTQTEDSSSCDTRKRIKLEPESPERLCCSEAAVSQTAGHSAVETSSSRPQPQSQLLLQFQHAPQLPVQASTEGAVRRKPVTVAPVVWSAHSVQSAVCNLKPRPQPQSQLQSRHLSQPTALSSDDGAVRKKLVTITPALHSQPVQAAVSQTAGHSAVEMSSSRPQPQSQLLLQSQHAPQLPVQASTEGAVRRKPVTVAPVVWSAHSVQSAVCSLKPRPQPQSQLQSRHLPQLTALSSDDGAVRKKLVTIAPALHSQPVQAAVETSSNRPQLLLQSQHAPQPPVQASTEGAVRRKPVTVAPVIWSAHSVQSAVCSLKPRPQPQSQLQSRHLPQLTHLSSDDGAVRQKLVTIAPALHSQPVQNQLDGRHTVTGCGQSTPSLYPALTAAESMGHGASTLSASTRVPMSKQSKIIIRTPFSVRSRIVRGPLERVLENIVKGRLNRIPHAIMSVPGLFDAVVKEVLDVIKKECKKLTSLKFTSILRQTSMKDLNNFKWMDVVAEWRMNAPTYLKFLESASSVSMEATTSRIRPVSHSKTNKYKLPMAGAILLNARCSSMSAHMYRNAMFICRGGAKRRFQRLNQLGVCISDGRALAKLKEMGQTWDSNFLQWKESVCQEDTASNPASGGADSSEFTASDECQASQQNKSYVDTPHKSIISQVLCNNLY
ncbi:uncharacterized protein LOC141768092 isoform X1 [Sebastes fasciatus]|uniref:uncharacterized protein LOC141768092 isoform X1 n=1 Tax=Sebastes fasciatus TaxID=394691 RepID=UPI003D9EEB53